MQNTILKTTIDNFYKEFIISEEVKQYYEKYPYKWTFTDLLILISMQDHISISKRIEWIKLIRKAYCKELHTDKYRDWNEYILKSIQNYNKNLTRFKRYNSKIIYKIELLYNYSLDPELYGYLIPDKNITFDNLINRYLKRIKNQLQTNMCIQQFRAVVITKENILPKLSDSLDIMYFDLDGTPSIDQFALKPIPINLSYQVFCPHPFHKGDIVKNLLTKEYGICIGGADMPNDKKTYLETYNELPKPTGYEKETITLAVLNDARECYHTHVNMFILEHANLHDVKNKKELKAYYKKYKGEK